MSNTSKQCKVDESEYQKILEMADVAQTEVDKLNNQASDEILRIESKYNKLRKPHYKARNDAVAKIPQFWLTVFLNHPQLGSLIEEQDEEVLKYLRRVEVEDYDDIRSGHRIIFQFDENPFFENELLVKDFQLYEVCEIPCTTTEIKWKTGRNFLEGNDCVEAAACINNATKEEGSRKRGHLIDATPVASPSCFFAWFADHVEIGADDIAEQIKDDLYVNPLQYYLAGDMDESEQCSNPPPETNQHCGYEEAAFPRQHQYDEFADEKQEQEDEDEDHDADN